MKTANVVRSILVPALLVAASAWADPSAVAASGDGHARAAALLSGSSASVAVVSSAPVWSQARTYEDGQTQAANLLSRPQTMPANVVASQGKNPAGRALADGHTKAAALLSRPRAI
jgi:hypothetical protein